jgi:hypothetical protein
VDFFAQSGRLDKQLVSRPLRIDQSQQWQENSALRGQEPIIERTNK